MTSAPPPRYCPRHHLPIGVRGCPRCDQLERTEHREEQRGFWRWFLRLLLPLLAFGALLALWPQPQPEPDRLDPELYRNAIETAESVLYRGERLTRADRDALRDAFSLLAEQMRRSVPSLAARRAIEAMDPFLGISAWEAEQDHFDVVETRTRWEALRKAHFRDAAWFGRSSQALEEAQTSASARGVPPDVDRYEASLAEIVALANRIDDAVSRLPDDPDDLDGDTYDRWQSQRQDVRNDVDRIREGFPLARHDVDQQWRLAHRKLGEALDWVGRIPGPDVRTPTLVPRGVTGRSRVREAEWKIQAARQAIAEAPH